VEKYFYFLGTHYLVDNFLPEIFGFGRKSQNLVVFKEKESIIAEKMYKYNRYI
jgi:hypothetical protein